MSANPTDLLARVTAMFDRAPVAKATVTLAVVPADVGTSGNVGSARG